MLPKLAKIRSLGILVEETKEIMTSQAKEGCTFLCENFFFEEVPFFFLIEALSGLFLKGARRRHWPMPIGLATPDSHSSDLKTA